NDARATMTKAASQARRSPRIERGGAVAGAATAAGDDLPDAIHCISSLMSLAVWKRSSGFFWRQTETTCSKAGGVSGLLELTGSGSFSRMEEATEIWLLPWNGRLPVTIS